ncbi:hypothetical protein BLIN9172_01733 [Brevibacterium linens ATCC 9172]|uniref:HNH endonuclease n=1 Tax=Brevibacterium linens ATCC 9172 TaxID=1255617 RepID=A0A2H1J3M9_BRELN|nr:hypothetical protein BLIN9172_01733 [Brevibacterium linens ATCC 9172]
MTLQPCIECGELSEANRCNTHKLKHRGGKKAHATTRGYDHAWRKLSEQARAMQPFCEDCGAKTDLQADHSPEAWERHEKGLAVRLEDISVVCGDCNRRRGAARGGGMTRTQVTPDPRPVRHSLDMHREVM